MSLDLKSTKELVGSMSDRYGGSFMVSGMIMALALLLDYLGLAIVVAIAKANGDAASIAIACSYVMLVTVVPAIFVWVLGRRRAWTKARALGMIAVVSISINLLLSPIGVAVAAM